MRKSYEYEVDIVAWSREQAQWLKVGRFDKLDLKHLTEEIEDLGKSEQGVWISRSVRCGWPTGLTRMEGAVLREWAG